MVSFDSAHRAPSLALGHPVRQAVAQLVSALRREDEDPTRCPVDVEAALLPLVELREALFARGGHRPVENPRSPDVDGLLRSVADDSDRWRSPRISTSAPHPLGVERAFRRGRRDAVHVVSTNGRSVGGSAIEVGGCPGLRSLWRTGRTRRPTGPTTFTSSRSCPTTCG